VVQVVEDDDEPGRGLLGQQAGAVLGRQPVGEQLPDHVG
jgi:hypothetical protein